MTELARPGGRLGSCPRNRASALLLAARSFEKSGLAVTVAILCGFVAAQERSLQCLAQIETPVNQRVAFVDRQYKRVLRDPLVQRGVAWVDSEGVVIMRVHAPGLEERRIESDRLVLLRPARGTHASNDEAIATARARSRRLDLRRPTHLALWAASRVLAGESAALHEHFETVPGPGAPDTPLRCAQEWTLELIPRSERARNRLRAIHLNGRGDRLEGLRIDHGAHERREMSFTRESTDYIPPPGP